MSEWLLQTPWYAATVGIFATISIVATATLLFDFRRRVVRPAPMALAVTVWGVLYLALFQPVLVMRPLADGGHGPSETLITRVQLASHDPASRVEALDLATRSALAGRVGPSLAALEHPLTAGERARLVDALISGSDAGRYHAYLQDPDGLASALDQAARAGHPGAQYHLAQVLLSNRPHDGERALTLLENAADAGFHLAMQALALEHARGGLIAHSSAQVAKWIQRAWVAALFADDHGVPRSLHPPSDWRDQARWLDARWQRARRGDVHAAADIGADLARDGDGDPLLIERAVQLMTPAAEAGNEAAQFHIAQALMSRDPSSAAVHEQALDWLAESSRGGYAPAQTLLVELQRAEVSHALGDPATRRDARVVTNDPGAARERIIRQAEWGNVDAQYAIIRRVLAREYSAIEEGDVVLWLNEQVANDHRGAMVELGKLHLAGSRHGEVARDHVRARRYFETALDGVNTTVYRSYVVEAPFEYSVEDVRRYLVQADVAVNSSD